MKKVVIIGPESTGKSTLCEQLSRHYDSVWVPEFARRYLLDHGRDYSFDDLLTIANGQIQLEDDITQKARKDVVFIDTDMYVMKVWCEFVFDNCHSWILNRIVERSYDLYLLCNIDLIWVKDELREYPDLASREKLYHMYRDILINQAVPWIDVSGDKNERLQMAVAGIQSHLFPNTSL